jgi:hypothetical protein
VILFRVSSSSSPSHRAIVFSGMFSLMGRHFLLPAGNFVSIVYIPTTDKKVGENQPMKKFSFSTGVVQHGMNTPFK